MLLDPIIARLTVEVPDLINRVEGAAELSELVKRGDLPQETPAAFVLPLGLRGGEGEASAGAYTQTVEETVAVILVLEAAGEATGARALPKLDELIGQVIDALCGWAPAGEIGVFRLESGNLVSLSAGSVIYQLNFSIAEQIRIVT